MAAKKLAKNHEGSVILIPLPPSVIAAFGCRPGTSIRSRIVDGRITRFEPVMVVERTGLPNIQDTWESYRRWWKARGSNANGTA